MKISQIKAFREVMLTGSVSQAARNLHRTQPSVSALISSLETDLGIQLFDRKRGRLIPVPEAHYLLKESQQMLHQIDSIRDNLHKLKTGDSGSLKIASMPGASIAFLPDLLSRFGGEHSGVEMTLSARYSESVLRSVSSQQFDLGLVDMGLVDVLQNDNNDLFGGLVDIQQFRLPCFIAVPRAHPLADEETIDIRDLHDRSVATLLENHAVTRTFKSICDALDVNVRMSFTAEYFFALVAYLAKTPAVAIVDPMTVESYRLLASEAKSEILFKKLEQEIYLDVAIIWPRHRPQSLITKKFSQFFISELCRIGASERDNSDI
ncbi:MAG: LysR family transcriptional regulator [Pseudomonadota bacterium]